MNSSELPPLRKRPPKGTAPHPRLRRGPWACQIGTKAQILSFFLFLSQWARGGGGRACWLARLPLSPWPGFPAEFTVDQALLPSPQFPQLWFHSPACHRHPRKNHRGIKVSHHPSHPSFCEESLGPCEGNDTSNRGSSLQINKGARTRPG